MDRPRARGHQAHSNRSHQQGGFEQPIHYLNTPFHKYRSSHAREADRRTEQDRIHEITCNKSAREAVYRLAGRPLLLENPDVMMRRTTLLSGKSDAKEAV
jgi:hypothetical protein